MDKLTPEMEAMLRINNAKQLAKEPDQPKKRQGRRRKVTEVSNTAPDALTAPHSDETPELVLEHVETVTELPSTSEPETQLPVVEVPVVILQAWADLPKVDVFDFVEAPGIPKKRGRGRPRKNPIVVRQPRGVLRKQQIHDIMSGDWEKIGEIKHDTRDIPTACKYKAKHVHILRDRKTGRVIQAASGEIRKHTSLIIPMDDKEERKIEVSASFA